VSRQARFFLIFPSEIPHSVLSPVPYSPFCRTLPPPFLPFSRCYPLCSISSPTATRQANQSPVSYWAANQNAGQLRGSQSEHRAATGHPIKTRHLMTSLPPPPIRARHFHVQATLPAPVAAWKGFVLTPHSCPYTTDDCCHF